jgi:hypothetical protein
MIEDINAEYARSLLDYEPDTGLFRWKITRGPAIKPGHVAGAWHKDGYLVVRFAEYKCRPRLHRLAFLITNGEWPGEVDHINGDRSDNRWCNLRDTTRGENTKNRCIGRRNTSGVMGVNLVPSGSWKVRIDKDKIKFDLGTHRDFFEAVCIRKSAEIRIGYHVNHGRPHSTEGAPWIFSLDKVKELNQ